MADNNGTDDYDIGDLEPEDAKRSIIAVMASLKQTAAKRVRLERELEMWENRVSLAVEKGRQDLVEGAQRTIDRINEDISHLRSEEQEYSEGLDRMKAQLRTIRSRPTMSVDVDLLNAQMEMMIGESGKAESEAEEKFREAEADWALEDLKRKMQDENE
jgi:phage shock protein A